jgi:molybdopterin-guanine dinucleotide biosynthesis protein B
MKEFGLAGWSGAGKTTLLTRLIPHFLDQGPRVCTAKHALHGFDVDVPGKDSRLHWQSNCKPLLPPADSASRHGKRRRPNDHPAGGAHR